MTNKIVKTSEATEAWELEQRRAKCFSASDLVPAQYQNNIPNTIIAMNMADRMGADPLMVMQHLAVIKGKPSFSSTFLIATINQSGRFSPLRFEFKGKEGEDEWGCRAHATDKESGEKCEGPWVTWKMVNDEGWNSRNGSKWKTLPDLMFHYRAAAFWSRIFAPEMSMGMHTKDEIIDIGHATVTDRIDTLDDLTAVLKGKPDADGYVVDEETGEVIPGEGDPRGETEEERLERLEREAIEGEQGSLIDG